MLELVKYLFQDIQVRIIRGKKRTVYTCCTPSYGWQRKNLPWGRLRMYTRWHCQRRCLRVIALSSKTQHIRYSHFTKIWTLFFSLILKTRESFMKCRLKFKHSFILKVLQVRYFQLEDVIYSGWSTLKSTLSLSFGPECLFQECMDYMCILSYNFSLSKTTLQVHMY